MADHGGMAILAGSTPAPRTEGPRSTWPLGAESLEAAMQQATELHDGRFAVAEPHRTLMYEASRTIRRLVEAAITTRGH